MIALLLLLAAAPVDRVAHIESALRALREMPAENTQKAFEYVRVLEQGACSSEVERLELDCLITAAKKYCRGKGPHCDSLLDLAITLTLAQERLISTERRYELMKSAKDYRRELNRELRRIQGALAVEFRLRAGDVEGDRKLAEQIDRHCLATADATSLPWQICAASLVSFVVGHE